MHLYVSIFLYTHIILYFGNQAANFFCLFIHFLIAFPPLMLVGVKLKGLGWRGGCTTHLCVYVLLSLLGCEGDSELSSGWGGGRGQEMVEDPLT